jgi:hypothetical protein
MKYLIFDAGPIISLTMNGMLVVLERLKENFKGEFIITPTVKSELIDRPMKIKKFELEAIQVKNLLEKGILKMSSEVIPNNKLDKETTKILNSTNGFLRSSKTGEKINLIHNGEAECLAFSNLCGGESLIVIDERTARMMVESPENLKKLMEKKIHIPLKADMEAIKVLKKVKFIRSSEILFIAYKRDLIPMKKDKQLLDALLYGVKFKGTAITSEEIEQMKLLV